jgi:ATP-binding cassette subfamily B protein
MPPPHDSSVSQYDEKDLGKVFDAGLMRRLGKYLRPYAPWVLFAIGLSIAAGGFRVLTPFIARYIINHHIPAVTEAQRSGLLKLTLAYICLLGAMSFVNYYLAYITVWIGQKAMFDLRRDIFEKLQRLSLRFFDRNPSGRLLTRSTSDVQALNELLSQGVVNIFNDLVLLIGIIVAWIVFDWKLALFLMMTGPLLGFAAYNFRIKARSSYRAVRVRLSAMNAYLQENLAGVRTVQSFNRERKSAEKYAELNAHYRDAQIDTVKEYARFFPMVELISALATIILLGYGGWRVSVSVTRGLPALQAGDFYIYLQYIGWFFMPIRDLAEKYNVFQAAMASSERIFQLMDEDEEVVDPQNPMIAPRLEKGIELRDVWFAYDAPDALVNGSRVGRGKNGDTKTGELEWALRGVSLDVKKGRTVALVGATGAGKSTVINLLTRLYDVQKGEVLYDGVNVKNYAQESLRRRMAIVLQDVFLFSGTIADNIRLGNKDIDDERVERAARQVNAHDFIMRLPKGYQNEVLERGATLSTGQKQLLAFARAMAFDPDILILDEATANIDTETEALIQDALEKLMRGRTSIVVAHRLSTIQKADKIAVFHHGRVQEEGSHQELLAKEGLYRRLYDLQYKI